MTEAEASRRIIVALDVASSKEAHRMASSLQGRVGAFKVGLELLHSVGPGALEDLSRAGHPVFCDCKLHDIPNTVAGAARALARHGVWMLNVHASAGSRAMRACVEAARQGACEAGHAPPLVVAVTLLTSLTGQELAQELRVDCSAADYVAHMARLARESGCDGVVCSPMEIRTVRWACGPDFLIVTPGVRPSWSSTDDQRRFLTPAEAVALGADYLVIGRPITAADDPSAAAERIACEIAAVGS